MHTGDQFLTLGRGSPPYDLPAQNCFPCNAKEVIDMMTVKQVSDLTGISIRTLQFYDKLGLLSPAERTEAGYRLYDNSSLERLQEILLFRELEFPLKDIMQMIDDPDFDRKRALEQHIKLLELKKERIEALLRLAREISGEEERKMDFSALDSKKIEEYTSQARASWGSTKEYKEFEAIDSKRTDDQRRDAAKGMMDIFARLGRNTALPPESAETQDIVRELHDYINANFYSCSIEVFASLGKMYGSGNEFTQNINKSAGEGTAEYASRAIEVYCSKEQ